MPAAAAALVVLTSTMFIVATYAARPVRLTMVHKITKLVSVELLEFFAYLALCIGMDLVRLCFC